jgi:predicted nucleic acid-binding protein
MGLVLDSSVLIDAERNTTPVSALLAALAQKQRDAEIVLSAISVIELEHGYWRATTPEIAQKRRAYLDEVFSAVPVHPFTHEMAQLAGKIDAEARKQGVAIPFTDLEIGVTALHFGYAIGTRNPRHFRLIPGLTVIEL